MFLDAEIVDFNVTIKRRGRNKRDVIKKRLVMARRKNPGACDAAQMKENIVRAGYHRTVQGCFNQAVRYNPPGHI